MDLLLNILLLDSGQPATIYTVGRGSPARLAGLGTHIEGDECKSNAIGKHIAEKWLN